MKNKGRIGNQGGYINRTCFRLGDRLGDEGITFSEKDINDEIEINIDQIISTENSFGHVKLRTFMNQTDLKLFIEFLNQQLIK